MKKLISILTIVGVLLVGGTTLASDNITTGLYQITSVNEYGVQGIDVNKTTGEGVWLESEDIKDFYLEVGAMLYVTFEEVDGEEIIKDIEVIDIEDFKIVSINYDKENNIYHYEGKSLTTDSGLYFSSEDITIQPKINDTVRAILNEDDELIDIDILNH